MSVEPGDVDADARRIHDVSDLTVEGVTAYAESAVSDASVHVHRRGSRTFLVVE
ncbi:MAG: hypothetical protein ABEJ08_05025 [Halobacteriaceae archaeon]